MQRTEFGDIRSACGFLNILYLNKKKKKGKPPENYKITTWND